MTYARVKDKKTGNERRTTVKAYNLIRHRYILLGYEDENGNPVDGPEQQQQPAQKKRSQVAAPAEVKPKMSPEEIEAKKAELRALNEAALEKARKEQEAKVKAAEVAKSVITEAQEQVKERKKPGPKPKDKA